MLLLYVGKTIAIYFLELGQINKDIKFTGKCKNNLTTNNVYIIYLPLRQSHLLMPYIL